MISRVVMRMPGVSKEAKAVYALLCSYTGDKEYCFPTVETLAADLDASPRQIIRLTEELKCKGLCEKVKLDGNKRKTAYIPLIPAASNGDTNVTRLENHDNSGTNQPKTHDTGGTGTGDTDGTLILTDNNNTQENNNTNARADNPIEFKPRGVPPRIAEQFERYRKHVRDCGTIGRFLLNISGALAMVGEEILHDALAQVVHEATRPGFDTRYSPGMAALLSDEHKLRDRAAKYAPPQKPVSAEPDYEAQTMQELENMTDAERAARFAWYAQTGLIAPQEAVKKWKHLMPNLTQSQAS